VEWDEVGKHCHKSLKMFISGKALESVVILAKTHTQTFEFAVYEDIIQ